MALTEDQLTRQATGDRPAMSGCGIFSPWEEDTLAAHLVNLAAWPLLIYTDWLTS